MALYIASDRPLPLIKQSEYPKNSSSSPTWPQEAQRFHTAELRPAQEDVRLHFRFTHVLYAGSYEGCSCGFNYGREYPMHEEDPKHLSAARESVTELVRYVRESRATQIYSCWFDEEAKPTAHERTVTTEILGAQDFFFRNQELLNIDHNAK